MSEPTEQKSRVAPANRGGHIPLTRDERRALWTLRLLVAWGVIRPTESVEPDQSPRL